MQQFGTDRVMGKPLTSDNEHSLQPRRAQKRQASWELDGLLGGAFMVPPGQQQWNLGEHEFRNLNLEH